MGGASGIMKEPWRRKSTALNTHITNNKSCKKDIKTSLGCLIKLNKTMLMMMNLDFQAMIWRKGTKKLKKKMKFDLKEREDLMEKQSTVKEGKRVPYWQIILAKFIWKSCIPLLAYSDSLYML